MRPAAEPPAAEPPAGAHVDPTALLRPRRRITGMSAVLLPFTEGGEIDWPTHEQLLARTVAAGLVPAVNMDTGYVNLLSPTQRREVLARTRAALGGEPFVAGAFVDDGVDHPYRPDAHAEAMAEVADHGATPVVFPSHGLSGLPSDHDVVAALAELGRGVDRFIAFELGRMFVPFGRILSLEAYEELLGIPSCIGAKHSSLSRVLEWQRLELRDRLRPGFLVLTGNDLAIDMVCYGSDYLLGLSAFAPDHFARRDALWEAGHPGFYELNDVLQYLGAFAFRPPVPAYKHSAAQLLRLRGWIPSDAPHPDALTRPGHDLDVLEEVLARLEGTTP